MLGSKMKSLKRLASKVKGVNNKDSPSKDESLLLEGSQDQNTCANDETKSPKTPSSGYFAVYVGEERRRFMVKTKYLSHPLFKMLLEKASNEFGYEGREVLEVPCSVSAFQEVVNAIESSQGMFDLGKFVEELF